MIVKKVKNENKKPKAWQIGDLVDYIRHPHNRNPQEKIEYAGGRNFISATHTGQKIEMIALARESAHSKMPVTHWIFSWREGEQPTRGQVEELVDVFLERMELVGHQAVYGLHHDTDNYHLHIAVNRLNPETGKVVQPHKGFDKREGHKIVALIEHKQGWSSEKNGLYAVLENGELARRRKEREAVKPKPAALNFECARGEKSAQRIAQERGHGIIGSAESWTELHQKLAAVGLRFEKKGSGAIIFVGDVAVKASSIDRTFSMGKLCKKLGEFMLGDYPPTQEKAPPEPVSSVNHEEWKAYQVELDGTLQTGTELEGNSELARMKIRHREERKIALSRLKKFGLPVLNIARHCLKVQQTEEMRVLRKKIPQKRRGKPRFETWLRSRGLSAQAERWRHRNGLESARGTAPQEKKVMQKNSPEWAAFERYAAAVGADRYRVTSIKMDADGGKKTFVLDKKNGATRGFSPDELAVRMPEMTRLQQRGENIYYTPLSEEKHHILIDDMTSGSLEKLQQDGFMPAVILESSPGNFQCILTIPKLRSGFDRDVGNRLTERLNRLYGDKNLSGSIHPHRAPGFENRKPKHRQEDGGYPQVRLLFAERRECGKALELARQIDREYAEAAKSQRERPRAVPSGRPGDPVAAYYAHLDNIKKHLTITDHSRVDAMIALRMRSNGHGREDVAAAVRACAPTIREKQTGRDWQRYAERTADYAFGVAGDVDLAKNDRYRELWRRIEGIEDQELLRARMQ
jgi:hypothetical protein